MHPPTRNTPNCTCTNEVHTAWRRVCARGQVWSRRVNSFLELSRPVMLNGARRYLRRQIGDLLMATWTVAARDGGVPTAGRAILVCAKGRFRRPSISAKLLQLLPREVSMSSDMVSDMASYRLRINGAERTIESSDPDQPLLYGLRGLGLTATKFGCGLGQCGACTVLLDGRPVRSCSERIADAQGKSVVNRSPCPRRIAVRQAAAAARQEAARGVGLLGHGKIWDTKFNNHRRRSRRTPPCLAIPPPGRRRWSTACRPCRTRIAGDACRSTCR
jgi:2Fe-2S iron-sulfur cluster binding domain